MLFSVHISDLQQKSKGTGIHLITNHTVCNNPHVAVPD